MADESKEGGAARTFNRRDIDPRMEQLLEQAKESHRTHIRTRKLVDDMLQMNGEILKIHAHIEGLSATTNQIRDILATFKGVAIAAKWIAAISAAVAGVVAAWHNIKQ